MGMRGVMSACVVGVTCGAVLPGQKGPIIPDPPSVKEIEAQFFYNETTMVREVTLSGGCTLRKWNGTDAFGISGPPWMATLDCNAGSTFTASGVADHGFLHFYLRHGSAMFDGETFQSMGDAFWLGDGAYVDMYLNCSSFLYVVGGDFSLAPWRARSSYVSSSFNAPRRRSYRVSDGAVGPDHHIANGSSTSVDIVFSKGKSNVDPPVITVVNCAYDIDPDLSFVWYHLHPAGAVYLPYTGNICYWTDEKRCSAPGAPRWVSPNLFYYESFEPRAYEPSGHAAKTLVNSLLNDTAAENCSQPIVFAVTNFDPDDAAGQPNFEDMPNGAMKWGLFETMTVRATTIATVTVSTSLEKPHLRGAQK